MGRYGDIIEELLRWARLEDDVRAVKIIDSQARTYELADKWSDLDVVLTVRRLEAFVSDDKWFDQFGGVVYSFVEGTGVGPWRKRRVL